MTHYGLQKQYIHSQALLTCKTLTYPVYKKRNGQIESLQSDNYTIFFGGCPTTTRTIDAPPQRQGARTSFKAGAAISIKTNLTPCIINFTRLKSRITEIRIKTGRLPRNLSVINPYSPDRGREFEEIKD